MLHVGDSVLNLETGRIEVINTIYYNKLIGGRAVDAEYLTESGTLNKYRPVWLVNEGQFDIDVVEQFFLPGLEPGGD